MTFISSGNIAAPLACIGTEMNPHPQTTLISNGGNTRICPTCGDTCLVDFGEPEPIDSIEQRRAVHLRAGDEALAKAMGYARTTDIADAPSLSGIEQAKMWAAIASAHYEAAKVTQP